MLLRPLVPLRLGIGAIALVLVATAFAREAQAATTLGQTAPGTATSCPNTTTFLQAAVGSGSPSYSVPAFGGVITSWSTAANATAGGQVELKLFTGGPIGYQVVAQDGPHALTPSTLNTFPARITVGGGEVLGLYYSAAGTACEFPTSVPGDTTRYKFGSSPDPPLGMTYSTTASDADDRVNVAARLELDSDHDGYGDETQDQCPTNALTQGPCPASQTPTPPASPPFGGLSVRSQTVAAKHGIVMLRLSCPASAQGDCAGTDTLSTTVKVAAARLVDAKKRKTKVLRLGRGSFAIAAGKSGKVRFKLNHTALKLLARKHTLKAKQTIVAHDSRNVSKTSSGRVKLKAAKVKKH
jgi:hypothetical protein